MTTARSSLIPSGSPGTFHCVQRCVRRAFLCGVDRYTGQSFEHRKAWVEQRLLLLADCFAIAIHAYAVMSNHLHLVVQVDPHTASAWSDDEVATRWLRLFPPCGDAAAQRLKHVRRLQQPERLSVLRARLSDLSWLMRCLAEPIARAANREDGCTGRFWEGRFKAQVLCDERAVLAAMAYVDLNPVRAGLTDRLDACEHTSIKARLDGPDMAAPSQPLRPVAGSIATCLPIKLGEYLALVEWTGQQVRPDKRGVLTPSAPAVLRRIEPHPGRWAVRVKAIGSGFWRIVGEVEDLMERAANIRQSWLKGLGLARALTYAK